MRLEQCRHVGRKNRHRIASPDACLRQGMGQLPGAVMELVVVDAPFSVNNRRARPEYVRGSFQEADRRERHEIGRALGKLRTIMVHQAYSG